MNALDKLIIKLLEKEYSKPISKNRLISRIQEIDKNFSTKDIFNSFHFLEKNLLISFNQIGQIRPKYVDGNIIDKFEKIGIIFINNLGDGFIKMDGSTEEYYVNKKNTNWSISGDKVSFVVTDKKSKNNQDAIVTKIIEHNTEFFVGTIVINNNRIYCDLDNYKIIQKIEIINPSNLVNGHKVWVKAVEYNKQIIKVEVVKILGHKDDIGIDITSIVYSHDVEPEFSKEVEQAANDLDKTISSSERKRRIDLTNLPIVTIDPKTSKDMDDGICVLKENANFRLYVAIADVAHYIKPGSILDLMASERATSIYLVNKVIPMLPHILSNDSCSLNPGIDILSMVCEMVIQPDGSIIDIKVYDAIINSKRKFAYEEVNEYFINKQKIHDIDNNIWEMLDNAYTLYQILRTAINKRGYIDFEIKEPKIILDEKENIIDVVTRERGPAQMLIENFMIAANEATTILFNRLFNNKPFVYRIHDKPNESKLKYFQIETKKLGFAINGDLTKIKPSTISSWLKNNNWEGQKQILINKLLLKTMAKAEYSINNIGHFGLASKNYTHFTSPIRRYPDVMVHQLFKIFHTNKESYGNINLSKFLDNLEANCENSSKKEIQAVEIEREVNLFKFCQFMENKIGQKFSGIITHVIKNGFFVELENLIEGMVRLPNINLDDYFIFDSESNVLIGKKSNIRLTFGTLVKIRVLSVNIPLRQIDFELEEVIK
ncbi:MAG: ribonuclease R [Mycoplasmoidaceae bacterium]